MSHNQKKIWADTTAANSELIQKHFTFIVLYIKSSYYIISTYTILYSTIRPTTKIQNSQIHVFFLTYFIFPVLFCLCITFFYSSLTVYGKKDMCKPYTILFQLNLLIYLLLRSCLLTIFRNTV